MTVRVSNAVVYFGGRRRWFSIDAACQAEAAHIANKFCDCEEWDGDLVTPPVSCALHADPARRERLVKWLAARARRYMVPVKATPEPETRALAAVRELVAVTEEVKRLTTLIGDSIVGCRAAWEEANGGDDLDHWNPIGAQYESHLKVAYEFDEDDEGDRSYPTPEEQAEILAVCPHCLAAHNAIQDRKVARRKLGSARRAITMIGRQK